MSNPSFVIVRSTVFIHFELVSEKTNFNAAKIYLKPMIIVDLSSQVRYFSLDDDDDEARPVVRSLARQLFCFHFTFSGFCVLIVTVPSLDLCPCSYLASSQERKNARRLVRRIPLMNQPLLGVYSVVRSSTTVRQFARFALRSICLHARAAAGEESAPGEGGKKKRIDRSAERGKRMFRRDVCMSISRRRRRRRLLSSTRSPRQSK